MDLQTGKIETPHGSVYYVQTIFDSRNPVRKVFYLNGWGGRPFLINKINDVEMIGIYYPGHGDSFKLRKDYSYSDLKDTLIEVVQKFISPGDEIHFIGGSVGASYSLLLADHFRDQVKSLTLICPCIQMPVNHIFKTEFFVSYERIINRLRGFNKCVENDIPQKSKTLNFLIHHRKILNTMNNDVLSFKNIEQVPTLVIYSDNDRTMPFNTQKRYLENFRNIEYKVYKGNHHIFDTNGPSVYQDIKHHIEKQS